MNNRNFNDNENLTDTSGQPDNTGFNVDEILLKNVCKSYGGVRVYDNFNARIKKHAITAILGESGSGKTTLLNIIAGLTDYSGEVTGVTKPVSFVFQRDRLVKTLTAEQNVRLVAKDADVKAAFNAVGLSGCEHMYPKELSAGMARRVAFLRAFLFNSDTVLMDEPFVNLDVATKYRLIDEVKSVHAKTGKTLVVVTHDVKEAAELAENVAVLSRGKIVYERAGLNVCDKEKTEAELLGVMLGLGNGSDNN